MARQGCHSPHQKEPSTGEHGFMRQAQLSPTGFMLHGRDVVTWLHLGVREAEKCRLECVPSRGNTWSLWKRGTLGLKGLNQSHRLF